MKNLKKLALIPVLIFSLNCFAQTESSNSESSSESEYSDEFVVKEKLSNAISSGDIKRVEEILKNGADANIQISETGETAIMEAVEKGNKELVKVLIKYGADPNQGFNEVSGASALLWAVNDFEMTKLLIEAGADINYADSFGATALQWQSNCSLGNNVRKF